MKKRMVLYPLLIGTCFLLAVGQVVAGSIKIVHPRNGSVLAPGTYTLIGKVEGGKSASVKVYVGKNSVPMKVKNGVFFGDISIRGNSSLTVVDSRGKSAKVTYRVKSGALYGEHLKEADCSDCHDERFGVEYPEDLNCYSCHDRKDRKEFVHGPIGGGACAICHDPHGSSRKFFLRAELKDMCITCHDQESSERHIGKKSNSMCNSCHDPHEGNNQYFLIKKQ